ncbi:MAG: dTDP-4-dehydrorhamnose 3,5-epimerase [Candidatus Sedimenticola sp. 6PFRAG7]
MFELKETSICGCFEVQPQVFDDLRGRFVKVFHIDEFTKLGLDTHFAEEYYSQSNHGVIRGMHFQTPPFEHVKVVYCVQGEVQDVVLDLRKGSPSYGKSAFVKLSAKQGNFLYIPKGLAHGFCVTSETATLIYKVSTAYNSKNDSGVLWNSFGFKWPTSNPILSVRDESFKPLSQFDSPFEYE